jgi:hypothetical protein
MPTTTTPPNTNAEVPTNPGQKASSVLELAYGIQLELEERFAAFMIGGFGAEGGCR